MTESRVLLLNDKQSAKGGCVLYVMSRDHRVDDNHALLQAQESARGQNIPVVVMFSLYVSSRYRKREHFQFMLDGLSEVSDRLSKLGIPFILRSGPAGE